MSERVLGDYDHVEALAQKLQAVAAVSRHDRPDNREAWTLAHALSDMEEAFRAILDQHLPALVSGDGRPEEVEEVLEEIGEHLRHIQYHVRDSGFFGYLGE